MRDQRVEEPREEILAADSTVGQGGRHLSDRGLSRAASCGAAKNDQEVLEGGRATRCWAPTFDGADAAVFKRAIDDQIEWISPLPAWAAEESDARID